MRLKVVCRAIALATLLCSWSVVWADPAPLSLPPHVEKEIQEILKDKSLEGAHVGLAIHALGKARSPQQFPSTAYDYNLQPPIFELNTKKRFMPASIVKLFTAAQVLQQLGEDFTFPTSVIVTGVASENSSESPVRRVDALFLVGGGDPSFGQESVSNLAQKIYGLGVRFIDSGIYGNDSLYSAEDADGHYPFGWIIDDTVWYYGPEINSLSYNRNQIDILVKGVGDVGEEARVTYSPEMRDFAFQMNFASRVKIAASEDAAQSKLRYHRSGYAGPVSDGVIIEGAIAQGNEITEGLAVPVSARYAALAFRNALQEADIAVSGEVRRRNYPLNSEPIAQHNSPPLKVLLLRLLKKSDNLYAEMLLRNSAYYFDGTGGAKAGPRAIELLKNWLQSKKIETASLRFEDGSGLSRYNLLTPKATAQLLAEIEKLPQGESIWEALPIAGVDGTLANRMKSTFAENNVRAKTGTFSIASNLSGYVTTKDGYRLAVALYINFASDTESAKAVQDRIYQTLASSSYRH